MNRCSPALTVAMLLFHAVAIAQAGDPRPASQHPAEQSASRPATAPALPPLTGVFAGRTAPYHHPNGSFTLDLPAGWSQANASGDGALFNPGLQPTDTLDCILVASCGELAAAERNLAVDVLLDRQEPQLRQQMAAQRVVLRPAAGRSRQVAAGEMTAAEQQWQGTAGDHAVVMWVGATVVREHSFVVIAVMVKGCEQRFLPGARRMLASVQIGPAQPGRRVEAALAGAEFGRSHSFSGGSMSTTYSFGANGVVCRRTMMSGSSGYGSEVGGDRGERGRYEVQGSVVHLRFADGEVVAGIDDSGGTVTGLRVGKALYRRL